VKFLDSHRDDILVCLRTAGYTKNQFSFRKKKGRIIIEQSVGDHWFSYYKNHDFFIDPDTNQKTDISHFEVKSSGSAIHKVNLWADVICALNLWLAGLN